MHLLKLSRLSSEQIAKNLVRHSSILMGCLILVTMILIIPASRVRIDSSGVSFNTDNSEEYKDYLAFVESFGRDDYILLAIKNSLMVSDPEVKKRINRVNHEIAAIDHVLKVIDLGTIESSGLLKLIAASHFWDKKTLTHLHGIIPGLNRLISNDMKTFAFIIKIDNEKLNGFQLEKQVRQMKQIITDAFPNIPGVMPQGFLSCELPLNGIIC